GRGRLSHRLDLDREDELGVLARTMNTLADDLQQQLAGQLQRFAQGDLSFHEIRIEEGDELRPSLRAIAEALQGVMAEAGRLTAAARAGQLAERADPSRFQGAYRELVE